MKKKYLLLLLFSILVYTQDTLSIALIVDNFSSYDGKVVVVRGILLNDFGNIRADRTSCYIVSENGKALNVSSSTLYRDLKRGQELVITGRVSSFSDVYQIEPSKMPTLIYENSEIPSPIRANTVDVASIKYHGDYVEVKGIVEDVYTTGTSGANIEINDGSGTAIVRVWSTTEVDISNIKKGDYYTIRGATGTFQNSGQILPSVQEDITKGFLGDDKHPTREIYLSIEAKTYDVKQENPIEFNLKAPKDSQVRLVLYSFKGQKIKSFPTFLAIGSSQLVRWNKKSDEYQRVLIGTYILSMQVIEENGRKTVKTAPIVLGGKL